MHTRDVPVAKTHPEFKPPRRMSSTGGHLLVGQGFEDDDRQYIVRRKASEKKLPPSKTPAAAMTPQTNDDWFSEWSLKASVWDKSPLPKEVASRAPQPTGEPPERWIG